MRGLETGIRTALDKRGIWATVLLAEDAADKQTYHVVAQQDGRAVALLVSRLDLSDSLIGESIGELLADELALVPHG